MTSNLIGLDKNFNGRIIQAAEKSVNEKKKRIFSFIKIKETGVKLGSKMTNAFNFGFASSLTKKPEDQGRSSSVMKKDELTKKINEN